MRAARPQLLVVLGGGAIQDRDHAVALGGHDWATTSEQMGDLIEAHLAAQNRAAQDRVVQNEVARGLNHSLLAVSNVCSIQCCNDDFFCADRSCVERGAHWRSVIEWPRYRWRSSGRCPTPADCADLFAEGGLVRGRTLSSTGPAATTVMLRLVAAAIEAGGWMAVIDVPTLGLDAASELGIALERVVAIDTQDAGVWGRCCCSSS